MTVTPLLLKPLRIRLSRTGARGRLRPVPSRAYFGGSGLFAIRAVDVPNYERTATIGHSPELQRPS